MTINAIDKHDSIVKLAYFADIKIKMVSHKNHARCKRNNFIN